MDKITYYTIIQKVVIIIQCQCVRFLSYIVILC